MKRALIIGGSLGGLFAANLLVRAGWEVQVFERASGELAERGAGIVTHPELFAILQRLGIVIDAEIGIEVPGRMTLDATGACIGERAHPQILTAWSRMYGILRQALPNGIYNSGKHLIDIHQQNGKVSAFFSDGSSASGDLLIGADGFRSTVRALFDDKTAPQYAGYIAWRGLVEESTLSPKTHQALFGYFGFCLPPREQMLGYPVAGAKNSLTPGQRRYNFVWYRPADEVELLRMNTDDGGTFHAHGIPPPLISQSVVAAMRAATTSVLAPQFAEVVARTERPFFQAIYDLAAPQLVFGRVVLLGDAAFVARPHCGMGVTKAAGDALALTDLMADGGIAEGLLRYNATRGEYGARIVQHARDLGAYMQAQIKTVQEQAMAECYRTPEAVMQQTAVAPVF